MNSIHLDPSIIALELVALFATIVFAIFAPQTGSRTSYVAMLVCAAGFIFPAFVISMVQERTLNILAIAVLLWVFLTFAFFVGIRVIMKKRFLDPVDYSDFCKFVSQSESAGVLARGLLYLGPGLLIFAVLGLAFSLLNATGIKMT